MYFKIRINKAAAALYMLIVLSLASAIMLSGGDIDIITVNGKPAGSSVSKSSEVIPQSCEIKIIMYHSLLKEKSLQGKYTISPEKFESDLKYLKENGYTGIFIKDLIDFVDGKKNLPPKPVMITFDDGHYNSYIYAYPLAKKYNFKIVISPIGVYTDKYSESLDLSATYSNTTWDNLREMQSSGLVEIQNHTYDLHNASGSRIGVTRKRGEPDEQYKTVISEDITKMQERCKKELGGSPTAFTYPFGAKSKQTEEIIKELGFKATLSCKEKPNIITHDKSCLYGLGRYRRPNSGTSAEFFHKLGI